jgi:DNA-binding transcriptional MerR regulator
MEYTIDRLAKLSGLTTRALRYYDEIGLLKPQRISTSGYRIYGPEQIDRLQQILFYRELEVPLGEIKTILEQPGFQANTALLEHRKALLQRRDRLDAILITVEKTLASVKGEITMKENEKFEGFKKKLLDDNEMNYGAEVRRLYGEVSVDKSNRKLQSMTEGEYADVEELNKALMATLIAAFKTGDPEGELAQKAADLHRQWLSIYWNDYSKEAHEGLVNMYLADPRFTEYYDQHAVGLTVFLKDAVLHYLK